MTDILELSAGRAALRKMTDPLSDPRTRLETWYLLLDGLNEVQELVDAEQIDLKNPHIRAQLSNILAMGETLVRDLPDDANVLAAQEDLRTRYACWYFMSPEAADLIINEVFGAGL